MVPPLLKKGNLVSIDPNKQKEFDNIVPIDYIIEWFRNRIGSQGIENRVLVLKSETASGKTTVIPPLLYDNFSVDKRIILVTQPRIITAIKNVKEILKHYKQLKLYESIGWQTGPSRKKPRVGVLFATIGVLTMQLKLFTDEDIIDRYNFIMLDEIHELSMEMVQALYSIKKFLIRNKNNPKLPFIICASATLEEDKYLDYFGLSKKTNFIQVRGFAYPKTIHWLKNPSENYIKSAVEVIKNIHLNNLNDQPDKSDILLFLPSMKEMTQIETLLISFNKEIANSGQVIEILKLDSKAVIYNLPEYIRAFIPANKLRTYIDDKRFIPIRKVIMSTSIAETGLTLDSLKYVIDSGYHRATEFYSVVGANALLNKPVSLSRIEQRKGRAGRNFPGEFYPLYPKSIFDKLQAQQYSEIVLNDTTNVIFNTLTNLNDDNKAVNIQDFSIRNLDLVDELPPDNIHYSMELLYILGFCDIYGRITELGKIANKFTYFKPQIVKMLLSAYFWECNIFDIISICAYLQMKLSEFMGKRPIDWVYVYNNSLQGFFLAMPTDRLIFKLKMLIGDDFINGLFLFTAIGNIIRRSKSETFYADIIEFSEKSNISFTGLVEFIKKRDELIEQMIDIGLNLATKYPSLVDVPENKFLDTLIRIKYCIFEGFKLNLAKFNPTTSRYEINAGSIKTPKLFNEKELAVYKEYGIESKHVPKYILYDELNIKYNRKTKIYDLKADRISSLDGFVNIDLNFI